MTSLTGSLIVHGQYSGLSEALGAQAGAYGLILNVIVEIVKSIPSDVISISASLHHHHRRRRLIIVGSQ